MLGYDFRNNSLIFDSYIIYILTPLFIMKSRSSSEDSSRPPKKPQNKPIEVEISENCLDKRVKTPS